MFKVLTSELSLNYLKAGCEKLKTDIVNPTKLNKEVQLISQETRLNKTLLIPKVAEKRLK